MTRAEVQGAVMVWTLLADAVTERSGLPAVIAHELQVVGVPRSTAYRWADAWRDFAGFLPHDLRHPSRVRGSDVRAAARRALITRPLDLS